MSSLADQQWPLGLLRQQACPLGRTECTAPRCYLRQTESPCSHLVSKQFKGPWDEKGDRGAPLPPTHCRYPYRHCRDRGMRRCGDRSQAEAILAEKETLVFFFEASQFLWEFSKGDQAIAESKSANDTTSSGPRPSSLHGPGLVTESWEGTWPLRGGHWSPRLAWLVWPPPSPGGKVLLNGVKVSELLNNERKLSKAG